MNDSEDLDRWSGATITYTYDAKAKLVSVSEPSPTRSLCEPDPETGHVKPVTWAGRTKVVYLCREAGL